MADPSFFPPYDDPQWQLHAPSDPFDIEQARPNLPDLSPYQQQEQTQPMLDAFSAIEQVGAELSSPWRRIALSFQTSHSTTPFEQDPVFASSPSRMPHQRSPLSATPSSKTRDVNPDVAPHSRPSIAQNQNHAYSPSPMGNRSVPPDAYSPPKAVVKSSSSRAKTRQLPTEMESSTTFNPTHFHLDPDPQLEESLLLSSMPPLGTTLSISANALGRSSARAHLSLGQHPQSQTGRSPRTPTHASGTARAVSQRVRIPQAHAVSPSDHPTRSMNTPSRGDEKMKSSQYVPLVNHGADMPSFRDLAHAIFEHQLQEFVAQYQVQEQDVATDTIAELKHRASSKAWKILALPPLDSSPNDSTQRQLQPNQGFGVNQALKPSPTSARGSSMPNQAASGQKPQPYQSASPSRQPQSTLVDSETALRTAQVDAEGSSELAKTHQCDIPIGQGSKQPQPATTEVESRSKEAKRRLMKVITQLNVLYAQRVVNDPRFQSLFAVGMQNLVAALFNVLALGTGLQEIIVHVWTVNDVQLLELIRLISPQLRAKLLMVRSAIKSYLERVVDPEMRWIGATKTTTMFYESFSGLKASLKERDKRRGDGKSILIDTLGVDRSHVWYMLRPGPDDELDGRMGGEMTDAQAQTPSGICESLKELDELQEQYLADLANGQDRTD